MIIDAFRKLFGFDRQIPQPPAPRQEFPLDFFDVGTDVNRIHDIMEQQMRSMFDSFNFMFGSGNNPNFGLDPNGQNDDPFNNNHNHHRRSEDIFSFFFGPGLPRRDDDQIPNIPSFRRPPGLPGPESELSPRDELFKPEYRRQKGSQTDENLDDIVKNQGPGVILDILKPRTEEQGPPVIKPPSLWGDFLPGQNSSSSVKISVYSNINGKVTFEETTRYPDGRVEKRRVENDLNDPPQPS